MSLLFAVGCSSSASRVATSQNTYDFRLARYAEACPPAPATAPASCGDRYKALLAYQKHLHEAAQALKNGGGMPLQLKQLKVDEKAVAK